jgi:hypothetical protein
LMLMLSEAGHKEVAAAAARKEKELSQLAAQKLKDGISIDGPSGESCGLPKPETIDESGVDDAAYVIRIVRGKTHYRLSGNPDMTFKELKAKLEPLAQAPHARTARRHEC